MSISHGATSGCCDAREGESYADNKTVPDNDKTGSQVPLCVERRGGGGKKISACKSGQVKPWRGHFCFVNPFLDTHLGPPARLRRVHVCVKKRSAPLMRDITLLCYCTFNVALNTSHDSPFLSLSLLFVRVFNNAARWGDGTRYFDKNTYFFLPFCSGNRTRRGTDHAEIILETFNIGRGCACALDQAAAYEN